MNNSHITAAISRQKSALAWETLVTLDKHGNAYRLHGSRIASLQEGHTHGLIGFVHGHGLSSFAQLLLFWLSGLALDENQFPVSKAFACNCADVDAETDLETLLQIGCLPSILFCQRVYPDFAGGYSSGPAKIDQMTRAQHWRRRLGQAETLAKMLADDLPGEISKPLTAESAGQILSVARARLVG